MQTTHVLTAHRGGATVYHYASGLHRLTKVREITHGGSARSHTAEDGGREHELDAFIKELAHAMDQDLKSGACGRWVVAAEPHMLGKLRHATSKIAGHIAAEIPKDFAHNTLEDIRTIIGDLRLDEPGSKAKH